MLVGPVGGVGAEDLPLKDVGLLLIAPLVSKHNQCTGCHRPYDTCRSHYATCHRIYATCHWPYAT
jgi:hypothetical protein